MKTPHTVPQRLFDVLLRTGSEVLNHPASASSPAAGDDGIAAALKRQADRIKAAALDPATGQVDYAHLRQSAVYRDYRALTVRLCDFALDRLTRREDKLAFWLNLYNALVMDGIIHYGVRATVQEDAAFFRRIAYHVGGFRFSADDIEHGILRANAGHPYIPGPQFGRRDPRRRFALERLDCRIHFALVCGAQSCPPVNFYDAERIDAQLDLAARNFLSQNVAIDREQGLVRLSRLLSWYGGDFGAAWSLKFGIGDRAPLLRAVVPFLADAADQRFLVQHAHALTVRFAAYDWALNGANG